LIKKHIFKKIFLSVVMICWMISTLVSALDIGLVDLLSSQLGVTKDQAEGGTGSIFQLAKQNLSVEDYWGVYFDATENIKKQFDAEGISIPFPQRDVHLYEHKESAE